MRNIGNKKLLITATLCAGLLVVSATSSMAGRGGDYHFFGNGIYQEVFGDKRKCIRSSKRVYKTCVKFGRLCNRNYYATRQTLRVAKARLKRGSKIELKRLRQGVVVCTVRAR